MLVRGFTKWRSRSGFAFGIRHMEFRRYPMVHCFYSTFDLKSIFAVRFFTKKKKNKLKLCQCMLHCFFYSKCMAWHTESVVLMLLETMFLLSECLQKRMRISIKKAYIFYIKIKILHFKWNCKFLINYNIEFITDHNSEFLMDILTIFENKINLNIIGI